jgi:hypothetical protein
MRSRKGGVVKVNHHRIRLEFSRVRRGGSIQMAEAIEQRPNQISFAGRLASVLSLEAALRSRIGCGPAAARLGVRPKGHVLV